MGIFNRKLLVLLIFINYFNNIYIFCDNSVEVKEIRDFLKKSNNYNKNTQESDDESTQESDDESPIDDGKDQIIDPTESSPIVKKEQGKITNWIKKNKILFSFLSIMTFIGGFFGIKSLVQGLFGKKNEMEGEQGGDGEDNGLLIKRRKQLEEEQRKIQLEKELLIEETIVFCDLNKEKLIDRIICYTEIIGETNYNKLQKIKDELLQELQKDDQQKDDPEDLNLQVELPTIEYLNSVIAKNLHLTSIKEKLATIRNQLATIRTELVNLLTKYNIEDLKVELPTIEYFNEVIEKNQNLINLINTPFNNINGEWQACQNKTVPTGSEGFLWYENGVIINHDQKRINNQFTSDKQFYKMYINNNKTIIAVDENANIVTEVVNFKQKFFIRLNDKSINIHFDNFKIQVRALNNSIDTWFPLIQFMKKQQYPLGMLYTLLGNANNELGLIFFDKYTEKNIIFINIDQKFTILTQQIVKKFKEIYEQISKKTKTT